MLPEQRIDSLGFQHLLLQSAPIRLQHLAHSETVDFLHHRQHARSERGATELEALELRVRRLVAPKGRFGLLEPEMSQPKLDLFEAEEMPKDELIAQNCVLRDDQREWERDDVVQ